MNYIKNIIFCSGREFNKLIPVVISSINWHSSRSFNIFILHSDLIDPVTKNKIYRVSERHNIYFIKVDTKATLESRINGKIPSPCFNGYETYTRLFITSYIDNFCRQNNISSINTSMYLDLDLIINQPFDIINKWNDVLINKKYIIAGAIDECLNIQDYINAGVILINNQEIRKQNIEQKFIEYIKKAVKEQKEKEMLLYADQDTINYALDKTNILKIPQYLQKQMNASKNITSEIIIHYSGGDKPWKKETRWRKKKIIWVKYKIISYFNLKPTKFTKFLMWMLFHFLLIIRPFLNTLKINLI